MRVHLQRRTITVVASMTATILTTIACGSIPHGSNNGPDNGNGGVNTPVIVTLTPTTTITAADPGDSLATEASTSLNRVQQSPLGRFRVATEPPQYVEYFFIEFGPSRIGLGIEFSDEWWSESAVERAGLTPDDVLNQLSLAWESYIQQPSGVYAWVGEGVPLPPMSGVDIWNRTRVHWLHEERARIVDGEYIGPDRFSIATTDPSMPHVEITYPEIAAVIDRDDPLTSPFGARLGTLLSASSPSGILSIEVYRQGGEVNDGFKHGATVSHMRESNQLRIRVHEAEMCSSGDIEPERFALEITVTDPGTREVIGTRNAPLVPMGSPELMMDTSHTGWPCNTDFIEIGPLSSISSSVGRDYTWNAMATGPDLAFIEGAPAPYLVTVRLIDNVDGSTDQADLAIPVVTDLPR